MQCLAQRDCRRRHGLRSLYPTDAVAVLDGVIAGAVSLVTPLQIRHAQREPYAPARVPDQPPHVHSVGIYNPMGNAGATHVRLEIMGMDPLPRNARGSPPEFPAIVPMKRGGDPRMGLTLNPDTEGNHSSCASSGRKVRYRACQRRARQDDGSHSKPPSRPSSLMQRSSEKSGFLCRPIHP